MPGFFSALWPILKQFLIGLALSVISYMLQPKPKGPKPEAVKDLEAPTADAGRPIPVAFGDITIKGTNTLYYGENKTRTFKINV